MAFEGFSAPRQIWPVRTITVMRRVFASVLKNGATLFRTVETAKPFDEQLRDADILRHQMGKKYSPATHHAGRRRIRVRQRSRAAHPHRRYDPPRCHHRCRILLNQLAVLHNELDKDLLTQPDLIEMRRKIAESMIAMVEAVVQRTDFPIPEAAALVTPALLESPRYGEYARNTVARYEELESFTSMMRLQKYSPSASL